MTCAAAPHGTCDKLRISTTTTAPRLEDLRIGYATAARSRKRAQDGSLNLPHRALLIKQRPGSYDWLNHAHRA